MDIESELYEYCNAIRDDLSNLDNKNYKPNLIGGRLANEVIKNKDKTKNCLMMVIQRENSGRLGRLGFINTRDKVTYNLNDIVTLSKEKCKSLEFKLRKEYNGIYTCVLDLNTL